MKKAGVFLVSLCLLTGCGDKAELTEKQQHEQPQQTVKQEAQSKTIRVDQTVELPYPSYSETRLVNGTYYTGAAKDYDINEVISYRPEGKQEKRLFTSEHQEASIHTVTANNSWLVWVDAERTGQNSKIYAQNLQTGKQKQIFTYDPQHQFLIMPALEGDYAAWAEPDAAGKPQAVVYDLKQDEKKVIGHFDSFSMYNNFLVMSGDNVLWTDSKDGKGYYKLYNVKTGASASYEAPLPYPGYAQLVGDSIFSINFTDHTRWDDQEFGRYDLKTKTYTKLDTNTPYINRLTSDGKSNVAVLDSNQKLIGYQIQADGSLQPVDFELPSGAVVEKVTFTGGKLLLGLGSEEVKSSSTVLMTYMK